MQCQSARHQASTGEYCSAHTGNEVSSFVGSVVEWLCVHFGIVEAVWFLWDCLWSSGGLLVSGQHLI